MDQEAQDKLKQWKRDYHESQREAREQNKKKMENLSDRDLRELMGQSRPTYKRHNGAFRQRG